MLQPFCGNTESLITGEPPIGKINMSSLLLSNSFCPYLDMMLSLHGAPPPGVLPVVSGAGLIGAQGPANDSNIAPVITGPTSVYGTDSLVSRISPVLGLSCTSAWLPVLNTPTVVCEPSLPPGTGASAPPPLELPPLIGCGANKSQILSSFSVVIAGISSALNEPHSFPPQPVSGIIFLSCAFSGNSDSLIYFTLVTVPS